MLKPGVNPKILKILKILILKALYVLKFVCYPEKKDVDFKSYNKTFSLTSTGTVYEGTKRLCFHRVNVINLSKI